MSYEGVDSLLKMRGLIGPGQLIEPGLIGGLVGNSQICIGAMCAERIRNFAPVHVDEQIRPWTEALKLVWNYLAGESNDSSSPLLRDLIASAVALASSGTEDSDWLDGDVPASIRATIEVLLEPSANRLEEVLKRYLDWSLRRAERILPTSAHLQSEYYAGNLTLTQYMAAHFEDDCAQADLDRILAAERALAGSPWRPEHAGIFRQQSVM